MSSDDESRTGEGDSISDASSVSEALSNSFDPKLIAKSITGRRFKEWYKEYEFSKNIRSGKHYFNGPSKLKPPGKFSASELLKCHRKIHYKQRNAPEENADPRGIFYFGNEFETDLAEEFLREVATTPETYVRNSMWVSFSIPSEVGDIEVNGSTDQVIVDEHGEPILLTEIKTTASVENKTEPNEHHKAQAHAYMHGLSENWERDVTDAVILYADRNSLDVKTFHINFDEEFWETRVKDWLKTNTWHRTFGFLPPQDPEQDWECNYCAYKHRCGKGDARFEDEDAAGFLPLFEYPRDKVLNHLQAHDDAQLTPTLANKYPGLAEKYGAFDWRCRSCGATYSWTEIQPNRGAEPPSCPDCVSRDQEGSLSGPAPSDQHHVEVIDRRSEPSDKGNNTSSGT